MKKSFVLIGTILLVSALCMGCIRPPNYDGVVTIQTDETAFFVDMTNSDSTKASETLIQKKDVSIPGYWVRTGRFGFQGYWRPAAKVIVVSRAPVRLDWDETDTTRTIRMTSMESSGFKVPLTINAHIESDTDATLYLRSFRPLTSETVNWSQLEQKEWAPYVKENARPLEDALNNVVFPKIVDMLDDLFVSVPIIDAERASKVFITAIQNGMSADLLNNELNSKGIELSLNEDIPSLSAWALENYGITIDSMAAIDGVIYDDNEIQEQINTLSAAKMQESTLAQQQINAMAQQQIDIINAQTQTRVAQEKARQVEALQALQAVENSRIIAEAEAEAIKAGKYRPVPNTVVVESLDAYGTLVPQN
ncbi:MAG: FlxA-like family protein [Treponema sp.]|jgi:hypothetical protein|nr:FlxA-like family protein [Treponema sp.]